MNDFGQWPRLTKTAGDTYSTALWNIPAAYGTKWLPKDGFEGRDELNDIGMNE